MKAGIKSTEFWMTLVSMALVVVLIVFNKATPENLAAVFGINAIYGGGRALVKAKNGNGTTP